MCYHAPLSYRYWEFWTLLLMCVQKILDPLRHLTSQQWLSVFIFLTHSLHNGMLRDFLRMPFCRHNEAGPPQVWSNFNSQSLFNPPHGFCKRCLYTVSMALLENRWTIYQGKLADCLLLVSLLGKDARHLWLRMAFLVEVFVDLSTMTSASSMSAAFSVFSEWIMFARNLPPAALLSHSGPKGPLQISRRWFSRQIY